MRFFKNKKKKKNILYSSFVEKKQIVNLEVVEEDKEEIVQEKEQVVEGSIKEETQRKKVEIKYIGTQTIAVASICKGAGSSYLSESIAYYISRNVTESVCIVQLDKTYKSKYGIQTFHITDLQKIYSDFDYIILDVGFEYNHPEVNRANIKIMICLLNENRLKELALFMKQGNPEYWIYLYNFVPKGQQKEVWNLMDGYLCECLPLYDIESMGKDTVNIIKGILKGGKK